MSEIKQLKRFIYSATVTSGSGSQSFYIDAKSREEADARAANNESDGMYADDSEVTDLDALDYEDETTVDDFGDFPLISREQSLIAQLEAAQKLISEDGKLQYIRRLEAEKQTEANTINIQRRQNLELMSENANLKDRTEKAEAALSAANEKLKGEQVPMFEVEMSCGHWLNMGPISATDLSKLPDGINKLFTAPQKPVVLPERYSFDCGVCADPNGEWVAVDDIKDAIKATGGTVEE